MAYDGTWGEQSSVPRTGEVVVVVLAATAVLAALFVVAGAPLARLVSDRADGWVAFAVDSWALGVVLVPLGVTLWAWLGAPGIALVVVAWVSAVVVTVRRGGPWPPLPRLQGRTTGDWLYGTGWLLAATLLVGLRLREVNFLPWIGDMGGYVNWANQFARTGSLEAAWPPFFPAYLTISAELFGSAHTTVGMALTGLLLVALVARLLRALGVQRWVVLASALALGTNVHAVWFSSFPVSESLSAPLLVLWLVLVHRAMGAEGGRARVSAWLAGVVMLALCLVRGNGLALLVPIGVLLVLVAAVPAWRSRFAVWSEVTQACGVAAAVGFWYGITEIRHYFVDSQLTEFLPGRVWRALEVRGMFDPTWRTAVLLIVGTLVAVLVLRWAARLIRPCGAGAESAGAGAHRDGWAPVGVFSVLGLGLLGVVAMTAWSQDEVWQILLRMGPWYAVGGGLTLLLAWRVQQVDRQLVLASAGVVALFFLALQAQRLGEPRTHAFHLYWDRYLLSEVLPCLVILSFVGLGAVCARLGAPARGRVSVGAGRRAAVPAVALGCAVLVAVSGVRPLALVTQDEFLDGAYELDARLDQTVGDLDLPVVWSADAPGVLSGFPFPNTWMAFAVPLSYTFGLDVRNIDRDDNFDPDEVVDAAWVDQFWACSGVRMYTVLDVGAGGLPLDERLRSSVADAVLIDRLHQRISLLSQTEGAEWYAVEVEVAAWQVTVPAVAAAYAATCG